RPIRSILLAALHNVVCPRPEQTANLLGAFSFATASRPRPSHVFEAASPGRRQPPGEFSTSSCERIRAAAVAKGQRSTFQRRIVYWGKTELAHQFQALGAPLFHQA